MLGWKILCDFDGTIVPDDVTDCLLESFADESWRDLEHQWEAGLIGAQDCMREQIALLQAAPAVLDRAVAAMSVDPGFPGFVRTATGLGLPLTVVSDGLDRVIKDVLRRKRLQAIEIKSSRFSYQGDGKWRLDFPYAAETCRSSACTCKCEIARRDTRRTLLVGDGRSDFCVAGTADFVFAKHKLLAFCRERGIAHAEFGTFAEATRLLPWLVASTTARTPGVERVVHG